MTDNRMPRARGNELVVEECLDETLVYDLRRQKAHCLNRTAALVWQHCDGHTTLPEMADLLQRELNVPADERLVLMALDRLNRARLLSDSHQVNVHLARGRYSRREAIGIVGVAGLLPLVVSIVAPHAAHAQTCVTEPACVAMTPPACNGQPICGDPGKCCKPDGPDCDRTNC